MTAEQILRKLSKRSVPASEAGSIMIAAGYSIADLERDLISMAMQNQNEKLIQTATKWHKAYNEISNDL